MPLAFAIPMLIVAAAAAYLFGWSHGATAERRRTQRILESPYLVEVDGEQAYSLMSLADAEAQRFLSSGMDLTAGRWRAMALLFLPAWRAGETEDRAWENASAEAETRIIR